MSLASAIAAATGLNPASDFEVRDDGNGPFLAAWLSTAVARPTQVQIDGYVAAYADQTATAKRDGSHKLQEIALEYLVAFIVSREFADTTRLNRVKAKIDAWKAAHPGVIP